jgi:hypothetical protein
MTLSDCHESFRTQIVGLAEANNKTPDEVYALWREYSQACRDFDQSALIPEFVRWYKLAEPVKGGVA